jgi:hypothetical protein
MPSAALSISPLSRAEGKAAGGGASERAEVGDRAHRQRRVDQQHLGRARDQHQRNEIGQRIIGQVLVQADIGRHGRAGRDHERVAVGRRPHHRDRAGYRAGAGSVLDDEGFAVAPLELGADQAREDAVHAPESGRRDDGDAAARVVVGERARRRQRQQRHADDGGSTRNPRHSPPLGSLVARARSAAIRRRRFCSCAGDHTVCQPLPATRSNFW